MTHAELNEYMRAVRAREWSGPDQSPEVEAMLTKERQMPTSRSPRKHTLAIVLAATLTSGALAAAATHHAFSRRVVIETPDGSRYDIELVETPAGAAASFTADDGTRYDVGVDEAIGDHRTITVDTDGPASGAVTVRISDDPYSVLARRRAPGFEHIRPNESDSDSRSSNPTPR